MNTKLNYNSLNNKILFPYLLDNNINYRYQKLNILNKLNFFFLFENTSYNRILLILKYMLIEKLTNNKISFIYDKNILNNKKMITGLNLFIRKQKLFNYLLLIFTYSFSKLYFENEFDLFFLHDHKLFIYNTLFISLKKTLFLNYFNYNDDYHKYLHYFEDSNYNFKIKLKTSFKYYLINRNIFRLLGINIF